MAVKDRVEEPEAEREPGFYVGNNGPYPSEEDAQAFIDGHLDGKGNIKEVTASE